MLLFKTTLVSSQAAAATNDQPFGLERRIPWTTSRVVGSPEPPLPYRVEKTFTNIQWRSPLFAIAEPHTDSLLVILQGGEKDRPSKILRVRDDEMAKEAEPFLQISNRLLYSVAFHPGYRTNGYLYLFSNGPTPQSERTNRISRITVAREAPFACDSQSERIIIEWRSAGHDGGGIVFGRDGMLYISTGDGTSDSDGWNSGQAIDDLLGGVLRIDVDATGTQPYTVPRDNPFVGWTNARPELWAYGLRNPWRMTVDQKTGQVWVGNNGQDLWEIAHLIRRGENYGWSVYEGSHPFYLNRKLGPTPLVPPTIEHHHAEARSLTGGVVYYGERFPELEGAYIYGDYSSGSIWAARHDGSKLVWHKQLARTELQIAAFAVGRRGELLLVDHGSGLYRLAHTPKESETNKFPTRLTETGLFTSTKDHQLAPGVVTYSVNAPGWADGAEIQRAIGLPNTTQIELSNSWTFPNGAVLMQTLSLPRTGRIETRLLTRQQGQWVGYSYRWNESQSDAALVAASGDETQVTTTNGSHLWRFPSRAECMACHSRAANFVLAFTPLQLNRSHDYGGSQDNQLRTLHHVGLFNSEKPPSSRKNEAVLVDPYESINSLDARARSYLHVNCSVCHVEAGGGNSKMELGIGTKPEKMNLIDAWPQHDTFGISNAMLVASGEPARSILYQRLSRRGRGQMPPLVSTAVDAPALKLFRDWIAAMAPTRKFVRDWQLQDFTDALLRLTGVRAAGATARRSFDSGRAAFRDSGCNQCHRLAGEGSAVGPDLTGIGQRLQPRELLESVLLPSKVIVEGYATTEIETASGELVVGHLQREDARIIVIQPSMDPAAASENTTITIQKANIRRRALSQTSNMPTGLVNSLEHNQVLDLLAYLISDANPEHVIFRSSDATGSPATK